MKSFATFGFTIFQVFDRFKRSDQKIGSQASRFESECVEFFAESFQIFGVPKSVGQIYGLIYASPVALSFIEIVNQLAISKGSASHGLHVLRVLGAINEAGPSVSTTEHEVQVKRGVRYEPELSFRRLIVGILREQLEPHLTTGRKRLNRLRELAEQASDNRGFYISRAKQLETWRKRFATMRPILALLLGPKDKSK